MSIGAITKPASVGAVPKSPTFTDLISFAGDDAYPTGGTVDFQDTFRAAVGDNREVMGVIAQDCGANDVVYDKANDTLVVRVRATGAEVANATDLSGTTFNVLVLSR